MCFISMFSVLSTFRIYIFSNKKTLVHTLFCLFLKLSKAFSVFLSLEAEFEDDPLHFPIFYFIYERNRGCAWYIYYILSFFEPPVMTGKVLWIMVYHSVLRLSVCTTVLLSSNFLGMVSLVFFWNFVCDTAQFWGENPLPAKMVKNDPNMRFWDFLWKSIH